MNFVSYANGFQAVPKLGLERIMDLLHRLGDPQKDLRCIHVAGTNGKGSVCMFLDAMLRKAGFCTGRYLSPNLKKVNERISVNNESISDEALSSLLARLEGFAEETEKATGIAPTPFEIWTAAAFAYFKETACDYVVLEVGMGGRYDATNVIPTCAAAVITRLDLDHTAYLGNTLAEIAANKCGIIKANSPVITVQQEEESMAVIRQTAKELRCPLYEVEAPLSLGFEEIYERARFEGVGEVELSLGGAHQLENAAIAVGVAKALGIPASAIRGGLESACHPARLEKIEEGVYFDGGHNPGGIAALTRALERYFPKEAQTVVFACMKDKDIAPALSLLNNGRRRFVFTTVQENPRAMGAEELAQVALSLGIKGEWCPHVKEAVRLAKSHGNTVLICGSLYLYGDL